MHPWTTPPTTSWPPTSSTATSATSWISNPATMTAPTRPSIPWLTPTPTSFPIHPQLIASDPAALPIHPSAPPAHAPHPPDHLFGQTSNLQTGLPPTLSTTSTTSSPTPFTALAFPGHPPPTAPLIASTMPSPSEPHQPRPEVPDPNAASSINPPWAICRSPKSSRNQAGGNDQVQRLCKLHGISKGKDGAAAMNSNAATVAFVAGTHNLFDQLITRATPAPAPPEAAPSDVNPAHTAPDPPTSIPDSTSHEPARADSSHPRHSTPPDRDPRPEEHHRSTARSSSTWYDQSWWDDSAHTHRRYSAFDEGRPRGRHSEAGSGTHRHHETSSRSRWWFLRHWGCLLIPWLSRFWSNNASPDLGILSHLFQKSLCITWPLFIIPSGFFHQIWLGLSQNPITSILGFLGTVWLGLSR